MEDRELQEMAAKAADIKICHTWLSDKGKVWSSIWAKDKLTGVDTTTLWNPLSNDGCALRLAAKLNLSIITSWGFDGNPSGSVGAMLGSSEDLRLTSTKYGDEPCAAWRRAIVLAAAEIGKSMP